MSFFDDPGRQLHRMEEDLLDEEEWEEIPEEEDWTEEPEEEFILTRKGSRPTNYAVDFDRTVYDDEDADGDDDRYVEDTRDEKLRREKKATLKRVVVAVIELALVAGVLWWLTR